MVVNKWDTIIIGSGVSGLTAGIILAKEGENVLVLEQHHTPGGLMQNYKRKGNIFPTGVHRLGSLKRNQPLWYYFNYLGLLDRLKLIQMDTDSFEQYIFPDQTYDIPEGHDAYHRQLIHYFPEEKPVIDRYMADLRHVTTVISLYNPAVTPDKDQTLQFTGSVETYLREIGASDNLKSVLLGNNYLYGLSPSECPLITHFIISDSYLNSSFRIDESQTPLADVFVGRVKDLGGTVRTGSKVIQILTENKSASGVLLDNGETLHAHKVIYTGHPSYLLDLCPRNHFRPAFRKRLEGVRNTAGIFGIAMKWNKQNCPVTNRDAYLFNHRDHNHPYRTSSLLNGKSPDVVFLSSLPGTQDKPCSVTALTAVLPDDCKRIMNSRRDSYKDEYLTLKTKIAESILQRIDVAWPNSRENIELVDTYSPATFERYTLTPNGTAYGIKKTANHFIDSMFNPATRIRNLYMVGQSIAFSGLHGSLVSSVVLSCMLFGNKYLMDKIIKAE